MSLFFDLTYTSHSRETEQMETGFDSIIIIAGYCRVSRGRCIDFLVKLNFIKVDYGCLNEDFW